MFNKVLVANRGEIAVRIIQTCREMGIKTVALYETVDRGSLHVRLADECVRLDSAAGFMDQDTILRIAQELQVDAIHPGYGFLAEHPEFADACAHADITFIGPPAQVIQSVTNKVAALMAAEEQGFVTISHSPTTYGMGDFAAAKEAAKQLGYPVIIKSALGGRGTSDRIVKTADALETRLQQAQAESQAVYGDQHVYLEKAIYPARQIGVQFMADSQGNVVCLGDHEGYSIYDNRKIIEESPSPSLTPELREQICSITAKLVAFWGYVGVGTAEFMVDADNQPIFTEIKARIQTNHPVTEMTTRVNLVEEQLYIAAGVSLRYQQSDIQPEGWAMMCRINAEDTNNRFMPSPGMLERMRIPKGPEVRFDTYVYTGCQIPGDYSRLVAKLSVWGQDRAYCVNRLQRALQDLVLIGPHTNLSLLQQIANAADFVSGTVKSGVLAYPFEEVVSDENELRDMAIAAAIIMARRSRVYEPELPERVLRGWHQDSRRLPN